MGFHGGPAMGGLELHYSVFIRERVKSFGICWLLPGRLAVLKKASCHWRTTRTIHSGTSTSNTIDPEPKNHYRWSALCSVETWHCQYRSFINERLIVDEAWHGRAALSQLSDCLVQVERTLSHLKFEGCSMACDAVKGVKFSSFSVNSTLIGASNPSQNYENQLGLSGV